VLVYAVIVMVFITLFVVFNLILRLILSKKIAIKIRLERIAKQNIKEEEDELSQSFFVRLVRPTLDNISKAILKITPKELVSGFEKKVLMAGKPYGLSIKDWVNMQVIIILCIPLITAAVCHNRGVDPGKTALLCIMEAGMGLMLPNLLLSKKISDRHRKITNSLPDVIDLLTVSVEAGLGFDGALAKVIDKMPGPLAFEFENVLQEIKVGKQKRDALKDMADRVCVQDLTTFIGSVIQAEQLGVSIGNVLRIQSEQMRQKRRQRAQEKAMKAPVKMLIPMILFIFPTIFSVLIGPIIIKVMNVFTK
jgi:tight adherence protein C